LRLVLLDNDPAVLDLLALDLSLEGHDVVAAVSDATGAIAACTTTDADVLVVDLRLGPGLDGLAVARRVARAGLRIVLYTNYVTPGIVRSAEQAGVT
jgi:DNA-binding NarL/FixJ family response regulator